MTTIDLLPLEPGTWSAHVVDGDVETDHRIIVPPAFAQEIAVAVGVGDRPLDEQQLVRESLGFLLDREPPTAILREFALTDISRYFPEYSDELTDRLRNAPGGPRTASD